VSQAMMNMWISFFALALMFVSAGTAIFSREKLKGWVQKLVLAFSFVCLIVSGCIVFLIVIGGPTATMK
jgi:cbb3-type cytochrome oxidase subunit 1